MELAALLQQVSGNSNHMYFIHKYFWVFSVFLLPVLYLLVTTAFYMVFFVWKKKEYGGSKIQELKAVGPLLNRDMVIPVDLPENEVAEFKISCGYLFWELDYVAMDYSTDTDFTVTTIKPYEAIDEKGANVLSSITQPDKQYLVQPEIGNAAVVKYKSIAAKPGMSQTYFLHSSGYYTHIRNYKGSPKTAFLKSFEKPGALVSFSRQKFAEGMKAMAKK